VAHQARTYPSFSNMKRQGVFLLSPGWDAGPLQGYPQVVKFASAPLHLGGERHHESYSLSPKTMNTRKISGLFIVSRPIR